LVTILSYESVVFAALDLHFARFITRLSRDVRPEIFWAAALVSRSTGEGNICLNLPLWTGRELPAIGETTFITPPFTAWRQALLENSAVGQPGDYRPLILDDKGRLYLYRYWDYEESLASFLLERGCGRGATEDLVARRTVIREKLHLLFPTETGVPGPDWQKLAATMALLQPLTIISGSPGTGKTTTATKIMALLLATAAAKRPTIALTAPTGKAAVRLQEAVRKTKLLLPSAATAPVQDAIPEQATTIHRLLGARPDSTYFHHDRKNPLSLDVVIVDEASMVDLPLMSKLVQALPNRAKLILLGDHDQLTSVEAGAVLGDICAAPLNVFSRPFLDRLEDLTGETGPAGPDAIGAGMQDCLIELRHNYRFGGGSGIGQVSAAVRAGDTTATLTLLKSESFADIGWCRPDPGGFLPFLRKRATAGFHDYLQAVAAGDAESAFACFEGFRVLCALRRGPWGTESLNSAIERLLQAEGQIEPGRRWYQGRPVMITRNDYTQRLFNGDVGLILHDPAVGNELRAFFRDAAGKVRSFLPFRLPEHETAYALTVHKSQGSEFDSVLLLLPDQDVPLLTRELIYTGLTRARNFVEIWGTEELLRTAVGRRISRTSGLRDALWPVP